MPAGLELQLRDLDVIIRPGVADIAMVELCLLALLSPGIAYVIWREWVAWRDQRRRDQAEAEALRAEGFPPGRPARHRPSKQRKR